MPSRYFAMAATEEEAARIAALSEHVDDQTVITAELQLVKAIELRGLDPQTATDETLAERYRAISDAIRNLECQGLVVKVFTMKRRTPLRGEAVARVSDFSMTDRYHGALEAAGCYSIRIVLALEKNARSAGSGFLAGFRALKTQAIAAAVDAARAEIESAAERLSAALQAFGPRPLGIQRREGKEFSEIASFYNFLLEARMRDVESGRLPLSQRMGKARLAYPHLDHIEFRLPASVVHGAMLGVSAYPDMLGADAMLPLLWAPAEFISCAAWRYVSREFALEQARLQRRKLVATHDDAQSQVSEIARMLDGAVAGRVLLGRCWFSVLALGRGDTPERRATCLNRAVEAIEKALNDQGFSMVREDLAMACSHWAFFPGAWRFAPRVVTVTNRNYAALAGLHNAPQGRERNPWGPPLGYFATPYGVPFRFSLHLGDLGNALVAGPSGSGKSVLLAWAFLHARALGANVVIFDKDRGANLAVSGFGGRYVGFREGEPTGINPVAEGVRPTALRQFLQILLGRPESDGFAASEIDAAVRASLAVPADRRRLRHVADALDPAGDLHRDLGRWVRGGDYAWVFDNAADEVSPPGQPGLTGFDVGVFLDDSNLRAPVLHALFERVSPLLDGTPTLVVIDEFWRVANDPIFAGYVRDWLATVRKRNGAVLLATQSLSDVTGSAIARTIVEQAPTKIFFGNRVGRDCDYVENFGLSREECELVRILPARTFLLRQGSRSSVCRLDLSAIGGALSLLSGRTATLRDFDRATASGLAEREAALAAIQERSDDHEIHLHSHAPHLRTGDCRGGIRISGDWRRGASP